MVFVPCALRSEYEKIFTIAAKIAAIHGSGTKIVLVEKLCMGCESWCRSSPIFLLPPALQSETIPRWLITAVRGPTIPNGPRAERQGQTRAFQRGQESRSWRKTRVGSAFHSFCTSVEI